MWPDITFEILLLLDMNFTLSYLFHFINNDPKVNAVKFLPTGIQIEQTRKLKSNLNT